MRALEEALFAAEADAQCMTPRSDYHGKGFTDSQQDSGLVNSEVLMGQSLIIEEQYQPDKDDQDLRELTQFLSQSAEKSLQVSESASIEHPGPDYYVQQMQKLGLF